MLVDQSLAALLTHRTHALRGRDGYRWTTAPQSQDAQAFFPVLTEATGVAFPWEAHLCEHMRAREPRRLPDRQQLDPPPR
ncbi:hypothetical protein ACIQM4_27705 [Streptomyces sp. NPDC091272]|uniref:hypothetical protein n=1 Tax=Streptomyces sp. NPDC091272 TaxID=3365981 RepID=UPI00382088D6